MINATLFAELLAHLKGLEPYASMDLFNTSTGKSLMVHMKNEDKNLTDFNIPPAGSAEYYELWGELIKHSSLAFFAISNPTEDLISLHKMLWEV